MIARVLCGDIEESRDHLFFECGYVKSIWKEVLRRNQQRYRVRSWQQEVSAAVIKFSGNSILCGKKETPEFSGSYTVMRMLFWVMYKGI